MVGEVEVLVVLVGVGVLAHLLLLLPANLDSREVG
jgi:hypothetical protein